VDVGCGAGRDVEWMGELGLEAIGLDRSQGMLHEARRRVPSGRFVQGSFTALPFANGSIDGS
jgi:ubiquinone/menaquinone biosynthesis C-methylase UbiE